MSAQSRAANNGVQQLPARETMGILNLMLKELSAENPEPNVGWTWADTLVGPGIPTKRLRDVSIPN